jgi:hypothetical protein
LLRNGPVNISAALKQHTTKEEAVFSVGFTPMLYNENLRRVEGEWRESPMLAFGRKFEKKL